MLRSLPLFGLLALLVGPAAAAPPNAAKRAASSKNAATVVAAEELVYRVAVQTLADAQRSGKPEDFGRAVPELRKLLDEFPGAARREEFEWFHASALFGAQRYAEADAAFGQILAAPGVGGKGHAFREGAAYQQMRAREEIVVARHGPLAALPKAAVVARVYTTPFGKEVKEYALSPEHAAFVASCDALVAGSFADAEWSSVMDHARAALAYLPAQILYNHGQYAAARARLQAVMERFPSKEEAAHAAGLTLDTYTMEGDYAKVVELAPTLIRVGKPGVNDPARFTEIREQAAFNLGTQRADLGDRAGAADAFLAFTRDFPSSRYAGDALFNAANNLEAAGRAVDARTLWERYLAERPTDARVPSVRFRVAEGLAATQEFEAAIARYEELAALHPDFADSPAAVVDAALLRAALGEPADAAKALEAYAARFPTQPDAEAVAWAAGAYEEQVSARRGLSFYRRFLEDHPGADPSRRVEALAHIARIHGARGRDRKAARARAEVDAAAAAVGPALSPSARAAAAAGAVDALREGAAAFAEARWTRDEARNVALLTKEKADALAGLARDARAVVDRYTDFESAMAALTIEGAAWLDYARLAREIPAPTGLSAAEQAVYDQTVGEQLWQPAETRGRTVLEAVLAKAAVERRWTPDVETAASLLAARFPKEHPPAPPAVVASRDTRNLPFARPVPDLAKDGAAATGGGAVATGGAAAVGGGAAATVGPAAAGGAAHAIDPAEARAAEVAGLRRSGQPDAAIAAAAGALAVHATSVPLNAELARVYRDAGKDALARFVLERLAAAEPTAAADARLHAALGELHAARGAAGSAVEAWRKALSIDAGEPVALRGLGGHLVDQHAWAEALPLLEAAAARLPDDADVRIDLGAAERAAWTDALRLRAEAPGVAEALAALPPPTATAPIGAGVPTATAPIEAGVPGATAPASGTPTPAAGATAPAAPASGPTAPASGPTGPAAPASGPTAPASGPTGPAPGPSAGGGR